MDALPSVAKFHMGNSAGFQMALAGGHAAAQADPADHQTSVTLRRAHHAFQGSGQLDALIAPLAYPGRVLNGVHGGEAQLGLGEAAYGVGKSEPSSRQFYAGLAEP